MTGSLLSPIRALLLDSSQSGLKDWHLIARHTTNREKILGACRRASFVVLLVVSETIAVLKLIFANRK